ncbi:MAG TPA: IS1634 family transposase [Desulfosporosinus sp.]|nr:IS1634 family transposase [Desulfosporosinus sp.]
MIIIAGYLNRLHFIDQVNKIVEWDETQWKYSPGVLAQLLVLLPFVSALRKIPLSRIHESYSGIDLELLVGEAIDPADLNDDLFGRVLDRIYDADCSKLFLSISLSVRLTFDLAENWILHSDTTSHVLYGDYIPDDGYVPPLTITYGYSKQKRNDLKQIQTGMVTDGDGLILYCSPLDGNKADCTYNNEVILKLKQIFGPDFTKYIYIADSKLLTQPNFELLTKGDHPIRFISRIPENFHKKIAEKIRVQAFAEDKWFHLGSCCDHPKARQSSKYSVYTANVAIYGIHCFIHLYQTSDGEKKVQRAIEKAMNSLNEALSILQKKEFACEPDAIAEVNRFTKEFSSNLVYADLVITKTESLKRPRGRPGKNSKPPVVVVSWKVSYRQILRNESNIEEKRQKASTFALLTNIPPEQLSPSEILLQYKGQNKVEHNFMLLKEPLVAATIFLEKPERIMALMTMLYFSVLMHGILRVIAHTELESLEKPPNINSNNRPLIRPNSDTVVWILSLFTMISDDNRIYIEAKMTDRMDQIGLILQLVRFDTEFIGV